MAKNINHVSHKKSKQKVNGMPQLPSADAIVEGEIAVNFGEGVETLSIKNESGDVVTFSSDHFYTEQKLGSAFTGENSAKTVTDIIEENELVTATALNDLKENKLDVSAYTEPTEYWVSGTGENAVILKNSSGVASGNLSVAEGRQSSATNLGAHAEGSVSVASGQFSHAEGQASTASGDFSHAEGSGGARATGMGSHAEGSGTHAAGSQSHAEGIGSTASGASSHAEGQSTALGSNSHAEGNGSLASGNTSHAEGQAAQAIGSSSHAEGNYSRASGETSHAEGNYTQANGSNSHAEGQYSQSNGNTSHAEGYYTKSDGDYSHAEGNATSALTESSHAEGLYTKAEGLYSHAEGYMSIASGESSHAEGREGKALGSNSHAEGLQTKAIGMRSHAEGNGTSATSDSSHAEGQYTEANGDYSHAEGSLTIANNNSEHASGKYNVSNSASTEFGHSGNTLFSVGNGRYDSELDQIVRHNAFEIRQNGDIYIVNKDGNDVKLQDEIGNITVDQVLDNTTSASTNPVSSKAVYDAVTDNELVWTNAYVTMSGAVSSHISDTSVHLTSADRDKLNNVGTMAYENTSSYSSATEVNTALANKANTATTLAGYGITNAYTKSETSGATELTTALNGKANTSDIADFFDDAKYELSGETHVINFYHGNTRKATIDATDFIKDGMIDDVRIENGNLVIDFNTASGKQDISIPLTDIFDPSNYYDKDDIDDLVGSGFTSSSITDVIIENEVIVSAALTNLDERKLDASAYTPTDLSNYYTKSETSGATEISNALGGKVNSATFTGHTADTAMHFTTTEKTNLDSLETNIAAISGITSVKVGNWDTAYTNNHTHSNKTALDSITGSVGTMAYQATSSYSSATQVNTALGGKSDTGHTHDDRYYTESELTDLSTTVVVAKAASATTAASAGSVAWGNVTDKPETYTPSAHNQASNTITAMTDYTKASTAAAIASGDTLNDAIGKLEKALDGKQPSGSYVTTDRKVSTASGLTGGGDLSADRTIGLATVGTAGTYYSVVVDEYGRVTSGNTTDPNTNYYTTGLTVSTAETSNTITVKGNNSAVTGTAVLNSATTSAAGLMSNADKSKLDGISAGAEVNQNAWGKIKINTESTTIDANTSTDTLTVSAGTFVTLTSDATNDKFTIGVSTGTSDSTLARGDHNHDSTYQAIGSYLSATTKYAGSSETGGAATSANKLNTNAGNATTPVYFSGGVPTALSYTIAKSVPSDAEFTDTTYTFDGTYNASTNKAATVSTVTNAIGALDANLTGSAGAGKTLTAFSQTDGKVTATFDNISITKSQVSDFPTSMTPTAHDQASSTITAMTGYAIASASGAVATNDTLNAAVGKLEKRIALLEAALGGMTLVKLTSAQYEALTVKDPNTMYVIND